MNRRQVTILFEIALVTSLLIACTPVPVPTTNPSTSNPVVTETPLPPTQTYTPTITPSPTITPTPTPKPVEFMQYTKPKANACKEPITQAVGEITYKPTMGKEFSAVLELRGLIAHNSYSLTINGKDGSLGNDLLKDKCATAGKEGYCDIFSAEANGVGEIIEPSVTFELTPGKYNIKFLIKDDSHGSCTFLFKDNPPPFEIEK
jgi:hypothetical protein